MLDGYYNCSASIQSSEWGGFTAPLHLWTVAMVRAAMRARTTPETRPSQLPPASRWHSLGLTDLKSWPLTCWASPLRLRVRVVPCVVLSWLWTCEVTHLPWTVSCCAHPSSNFPPHAAKSKISDQKKTFWYFVLILWIGAQFLSRSRNLNIKMKMKYKNYFNL